MLEKDEVKPKILLAILLIAVTSFGVFRWEKQVETRREVVGIGEG